MSWFKSITSSLLSKGDFDEEFVLVFLCSLIMNTPLLLIGNTINIESTLSCFIQFETIICNEASKIDVNSPEEYTLVKQLELASSSFLTDVALAQKRKFIFCISATQLWTLPSTLLRQIPLSYVLNKSFPIIEPIVLLPSQLLTDLQSQLNKIYLSPNINIKIHDIISHCRKHQMISCYNGSKLEFLQALKALCVVLEKDFVNESMIPAICEKSMLHKLKYMPDIIWTILPDKRSFIEERRTVIFDIVKQTT